MPSGRHWTGTAKSSPPGIRRPTPMQLPQPPRHSCSRWKGSGSGRWSTPPASSCTPAWGGRCFPQRAVDALSGLNRCCNLQIDLETGLRGKRNFVSERLLCELTGAEAAMVVNNNAAATLLILTALCRGKEVIVSRGQLIEIGGSFRLPECIRQSGATLVEVGTTNKTHLRDYESAITGRPAPSCASIPATTGSWVSPRRCRSRSW